MIDDLIEPTRRKAMVVTLSVTRTQNATLDGAGVLLEGDAVRLTAAGSPSLTAGTEGTEVLIWSTD